jgi:hypothetical protein
MRALKPRALFLALLFALPLAGGCNGSSPTSPTESQPHGRLAGTVTIGPNCPGPQTTTAACPTPPSAYLARQILVYNAAKTTLLHTVDIDTTGLYTISLVPADYVIDLKTSSAADRSNLPQNISIRANVTTTVDVAIDTGIR